MGLPYRPVPKPKHKRRTPKRVNRGKFKKDTRNRIVERDNGLCVRCYRKFDDIHHIIFKSQGGAGTVDNGVCVCRKCHSWAHTSNEGRRWFEGYRMRYLI
ncbi:HNH endonuclease [Chengkuizengella sp. SCS-71B]|uniref:HNH endonuclease n=1 Tax=Chengkuizengella sp. SCS-71B TaxID=3115290 RepID=UPI0032C24779